jgi:uridylate kinase
MMDKPVYKRVLLKLSGEVLMGKGSYGIDLDAVSSIAGEIGDVARLGVEIGVVVGGGNIFRGLYGDACYGYKQPCIAERP